MSHNPFHMLKVASVARNTRDAVVVTFDLPPELAGDFRFRPGQYLTLRTRLDGEEVRRSYSICSAPGDGVLRVAIKKVDEGVFSNWANHELQPGQSLEVMPPANASPSTSTRTTRATMWRSRWAAASRRCSRW